MYSICLTLILLNYHTTYCRYTPTIYSKTYIPALYAAIKTTHCSTLFTTICSTNKIAHYAAQPTAISPAIYAAIKTTVISAVYAAIC